MTVRASQHDAAMTSPARRRAAGPDPAARRRSARAETRRAGPAHAQALPSTGAAGQTAEIRRWAAQLAAVQASVSRMNRLTTVPDIGAAVVEETRRVIDYHNCRVYLLEPPDDLVPIAIRGEVGAYDEIPLEVLRTKVGEGFTGWAAAHGESLRIDDAMSDPRGATIAGTDDIDESMIVVPMRSHELVIGVVTLSKLGLRQFDDLDLQLMNILADAAATAIRSVRATDDMRRATDRMARLLAMSSDLSRTLDPRTVADLMARHLCEAAGADEAAISYWDPERDTVLSWGYHPPQPSGVLQPEFALADFPLTRRVLEEGLTVHIDVHDGEADEHEVEHLLETGFASLAMLPLVAGGRSVGLVELMSVESVVLDPDGLDLVRAMANEAAFALENARLYERAQALADRDPLTDFLNHRAFHERLGDELLRAQRARRPVGLLMIDLDGFKLVNDTRGHPVGDQVLRWTAERIRSAIRAADVPARYGGDEFVVILPDADLGAARIAGGRIMEAFVGEGFAAGDAAPVPIGVSVGVAAFPSDGRSPSDLVAAADRALYRVKRRGGAGVTAVTDVEEVA
jgi:diguanylate cyclase (GGDEF)-like protein